MSERNYLKTEAVFLAEKTPKNEVVVTPPLREDTLNVTENGTYQAPIGKGYTDVEVNVEGSYYFDLVECELDESAKNITETLSVASFNEAYNSNKPIIVQFQLNKFLYMAPSINDIFQKTLRGFYIIETSNVGRISEEVIITNRDDETILGVITPLHYPDRKIIHLNEDAQNPLSFSSAITQQEILEALQSNASIYVALETVALPNMEIIAILNSGYITNDSYYPNASINLPSQNLTVMVECTSSSDAYSTWQATIYQLTPYTPPNP